MYWKIIGAVIAIGTIYYLVQNIFSNSELTRKKTKILLGLSVLVLVGLGVILYNNPLTFVTFFFLMTGWISQYTGLNIWLARMIALPFAAIITIGVLRALSLKKRQQIEGMAILSVVFAVWCGGMFYMTKDYVFNPQTGEATCYATTPTGFEYVPCDWKIHPVYGTAVKPVTREVVNADWNKKNGVPKIKRLEPTKDLRFFSPGGDPLVWYYQYADGKLEFFSQPGIHPQFAKPLLPVTPEIITLLFKYLDEKKASMVAVASEGKKSQTASGLDFNPTSGRELEKLANMLAEMK